MNRYLNKDWERFQARANAVRNVLARQTDTRFPTKPVRSAELGPYVFQVYRKRFWLVDDGVYVRSLRIEICLDGVTVGAGNFREWRSDPFIEPFDVWQAADSLSQEDADGMELLCAFWRWEDWPLQFGNAVIFSRLAIDPMRDTARLALSCLSKFLPVEFGRRASVMVLKCFPLEFENSVNGVADRETLFNHRLKAMRRHYRSSLGIEPFHTDLPDWMWRNFRWTPDPLVEPRQDWRADEF